MVNSSIQYDTTGTQFLQSDSQLRTNNHNE